MGYKNSSYLVKRSGIFFYNRRIPKDLYAYYSLTRIRISLKTKSKRTAELGAPHISLDLESYWSSIRLNRISDMHAQIGLSEFSKTTLVSALKYYLDLKGTNKTKLFHLSARRSINYAVECLGNKGLVFELALISVKKPNLSWV
jgi:hypothetical protein